METYPWTLTQAQLEAMTNDRLDAIREMLVANGYQVGAMSVYTLPPPTLWIEASADPTGLLQAWTPTPSAGRNKLLQARSIAFAFRDKVMVNPAMFTENDRATAAAITLIERLARMD